MKLRRPDIKPYRGLVGPWNDEAWNIGVRNWQGADLFFLSAEDVFDLEVLHGHFVLANLVVRTLEFRSRGCIVSFDDAFEHRAQVGRVLRILNKHYSHFKGRPIQWTGDPRR